MEIWWIIIIIVAVAAFLSALLAIASSSGEKFMALYDQMMAAKANAHRTILDFITEQNYGSFDGKLKIVRTEKTAGDAYNIKHKALILSDKTLAADSIGAFTIVAHELGHAYQDLTSKKLKVARALKVTGSIIGKLFLPAVIACIVLLFFPQYLTYAIITGSVAAGIFIYAAIVKLYGISIEKDASKRAIKMLDAFLPNDEMKSAKKLLRSARLTYWGDFVRLLLGWALVRKTKMF